MELVKHPGFKAAEKSWNWAYSKLKNFEVCPKRHLHVDLLKDAKEEESDTLIYGNQVHKILADYISKGTPIPDMHKDDLQYYGDMGRRIKGIVKVEQKYAITEDFGPTGYFSNNVWHRGVGDVVGINGPVAIALDWKTGKILNDSVQLTLMAACIFAHHPEVMAIRTEFVWLKHNCSSRINVHRSDMPKFWAGVLPRVQLMRHAAETNNYPPKPGGLCRNYCPVKQCPHHGVG